MAGYIKVDDLSLGSSDDLEKENLLGSEVEFVARGQSSTSHRFLVPTLAVSNIFLLFTTFILSLKVYQNRHPSDPSLLVYSPANEAVEYVEKQFDATFFSHGNEYMGYPTDKTDELWEDLYNFGVSVVTTEEAARLPTPTLPITGTDKYLIELDVFHELHCLNRIRKVFYPERFGDRLHDLMDAEGNVNRSANAFRHWDHCIDTIRQSLMCHADVSPLSFHVTEPPLGAVGNIGVFPRLATLHSCRNYHKIKDWALAHQADRFKYLLTPEEAQHIKDTAGFDQGPTEDLSVFSNGS